MRRARLDSPPVPRLADPMSELTPETARAVDRYLVDTLVVQIVGALGYRMTRVTQMTDKYRWLYLPDGPLFWKDRA